MPHNKYLLPGVAKNHKDQILSPELSNLTVSVYNLHPKDIRFTSHSPTQHCVVLFFSLNLEEISYWFAVSICGYTVMLFKLSARQLLKWKLDFLEGTISTESKIMSTKVCKPNFYLTWTASSWKAGVVLIQILMTRASPELPSKPKYFVILGICKFRFSASWNAVWQA